MSRRKSWVPLFIALVIAVLWYGFRSGWFDPSQAQTATTAQASAPAAPENPEQALQASITHQSPHLALGTPTDASPEDETLLIKPQYALAYKAAIVSPAWVAWKIDASSYGTVPRYKGKFYIETGLPSGLPLATHEDYTRTGYDRGHLCRSLDRTDTVDNNRATFSMANIIPQTHDLNGGPWLKFEDYCASLARESGKTVWIVAGGAYPAEPARIGKNRIAVPLTSWKVVAVLDRGIDPVTLTTPSGIRLIAVEMPNSRGIIRHDWRRYRLSVDQIEAKTGYDFFGRLPLQVQQKLEAQPDTL